LFRYGKRLFSKKKEGLELVKVTGETD